MENPRSQTKVAMTYGLMYGLASAVVMLLFYFMNTDVKSKAPQYIGWLLLIAFIVAGTKSYRDTDLGGFIGYGKALGTGTLISIFGGVITGAFTLLFFTFIAPEMTQKILDMSQQQLMDQGMSEDQIAVAMDYTKKFMTPTWLFIFSIVGSAFIGFIFSLITSIFLKKEQNPFGTNSIG
ncbi:MAG TPA: DUF4199 domain-containing protein, partial [Bacteroidia bacterium]|nr:DUF4199 domain-containing protein [Bacteroidia bacterium]HNP99770.1 DUF4199 domain-containing protein [Bacteroidia bacterium]